MLFRYDAPSRRRRKIASSLTAFGAHASCIRIFASFRCRINKKTLDNMQKLWYTLFCTWIRACSSAGRALRSQRRGRGFDPLQVHHVRAKCVWLRFRRMAKTSVHFLALPSPQKANGFSGTPEVLLKKVRISKHLLHQKKAYWIFSTLFSAKFAWRRAKCADAR